LLHLLAQPCIGIYRASFSYWVRKISSLWKLPLTVANSMNCDKQELDDLYLRYLLA